MSKHQPASSARISLENKIESLTSELNQLRLENSVLQRFNEKKARELGGDDDDKRKKKGKKNMAVKLTVDQKCDIANVINDEIQQELESSRKNSEKMIDTLRAVLEETEIRIGELKRDAYEFKVTSSVFGVGVATSRAAVGLTDPPPPTAFSRAPFCPSFIASRVLHSATSWSGRRTLATAPSWPSASPGTKRPATPHHITRHHTTVDSVGGPCALPCPLLSAAPCPSHLSPLLHPPTPCTLGTSRTS